MSTVTSATVDGNLFLQGNRLAIGIGATGSFGTSVDAPENFFTDTANGFENLGIYADLDGFGTGSAPDFRDVAVPGIPEERFNLGYRLSPEGEPIVYSNSDLVPGAGTALPVTSVTDLSSGTTLAAEWVGEGEGGLEVTQVVSFEADDTYVKVTVTLTNTSEDDLYDVRYMRNIDPDQAPEFQTSNYILDQSEGNVLIAAYVPSAAGGAGFPGTAPFFYYSNDPRAVVANFGFTNADPYAPQVTTAIQPAGTTTTSDTALAIAFDVGALAAGESTTITFYLGVAADLDEVIGTIVPEIENPDLDISPARTIYLDTLADDDFSAVSGSVSFSGSAPSYDISGSVASSAMSGYDRAASSAYGTIYLSSDTGAFTFVPLDAAIEALSSDIVETFEVLATDGSASASGSITIDLRGVNDRPDLAASVTAAHFVNTSANDSFATATGQMTATDRDSGSVLAFGVDGGAPVDATAEVAKAGLYGVLFVNTLTGAYRYVPNDAAIEALAADASETFTLTVTDKGGLSDSETFTVNLTGDGGVFVAIDDSVRVSEAGSTLGVVKATGNVLLNDGYGGEGAQVLDEGSGLTVTRLDGKAVGEKLVVEGTYGTLTLHADGSYSYAYRNTDALIAGESGTDSFAYTVSDGVGGKATATLSVTVEGTDLTLTASGTVIAQRGDDALTGKSGADKLAGRAGEDHLKGEGGADTLWGEEGNDTIEGGAGNDQGVGGAGDDLIQLGEGDDRGWGEAGDDTIEGGTGADRVDGGSGDDLIDLGLGNDRGWGGSDDDAMLGGDGADRLSGETGDDALDGGLGNDRLWGGDGNDLLDGGAGSDLLYGGTGEDEIRLGPGSDAAFGGTGADRFVFAADFGTGVIEDFEAGDTIVLAGLFASFGQLQGALKESGGDTIITVSAGHAITIENTVNLTAGDFSFL